uniref:Solute carrier family 15 member 1 n=1 Tax=Maylandia zebra TaxID=106582 RepID=A0A3P9B6M5_9CICH
CIDKEDPKKRGKGKGKSKDVCGYPLSIFFIVVNEFCERFSYYGILLMNKILYLRNVHVYFLTALFQSSSLRTIVYLSIVYTIGQVAMAVSAVHDITDSNRDGTPDNMTFHVALSMVGLFLIALGTGGIKPCVAAFGGDQFSEHQDKQRRTFFSVFYLCINGGSLLSTIITPILRGQECGIYSQQKCYSLAFGVPAALMVVALVVFIVGSGMYYKAEPEGNIMLDVCKCIGFAINNRYRHRSNQYPRRQHWMDWAEEKYDKLLIAQIKMVLKVLFLYIPLPMFWTLFDQKGSRWTLQATTMNGYFGKLVIQPDQMQIFNPILILTLVPIMDSVIYPLIKKCGFNFTPLKRMTVGMFLAAMAFVCAALVQVEIDKTLPVFPSASQSQLKLLNMGSSAVTVNLPGNESLTLNAAQASDKYFTFETEQIIVSVGSPGMTQAIFLKRKSRQTLLIPSVISNEWLLTQDLTCKPGQGNNEIRFVNGMNMPVNVTTSAVDLGLIEPFYYSTYSTIKNGDNIFFSNDQDQILLDSITVVEDIEPNSVHMALQIPQYFFITAGEVMFSVTGLEFSYSQAPSNMKAVLQAGWLFTVAIGNFIVLIVAEIAKLPNKWAEYVLFASLLVLVCIIFSTMAYFYTYIDPSEIEDQFSKKVDEDEDDKDKREKAEIKMVRRDSAESYDDSYKQSNM